MPASLNDIAISKTLSWLLRHSSAKEGLTISSDGHVPVTEILSHRSLRGKCNLNDIERVVENNDKKRFTLSTIEGILYIKANQGHSQNVANELQLEELTLSSNLEFDVIHGTYKKFWNKIKKEGLSRKTRNHIHFAVGLPNDRRITSGIRRNCEIVIYINLKQALLDGIKFYKSINGVILSSGDGSGYIKPKYFLKVCNIDGSVL